MIWILGIIVYISIIFIVGAVVGRAIYNVNRDDE
jgi:hypothetical protein